MREGSPSTLLQGITAHNAGFDPCSQGQFRRLLVLLETFPLLEELIIVGSRLFPLLHVTQSEISTIIRLDTKGLCFHLPALGAILLALQESSTVKIFEIHDNRQKVRWTRQSKDDRFEREGYTM